MKLKQDLCKIVLVGTTLLALVATASAGDYKGGYEDDNFDHCMGLK